VAFLIPDNLRSRRDVPTGVSRLARALQDGLGHESTVWYEPLFDVDGDRPDVVVLVPDAGVLVIEVLEAKAGAIQGVRDGQLVLHKDGHPTMVVDPLSRAAVFGEKLRERIAGHPLLALDERLPVAWVGAFAFLSRTDGEARGITEVVDSARCLWRDDLDSGAAGDSDFGRIVARLLAAPLRDSLSGDAEKVYRAIIHPDAVIGPEQLQLGPIAHPPSSDELRVLDRRQEALAKTLGGGHRVIRGVAGSGKTLVLTYRAKLLAENLPKQRILVTCYTRSLRARLDAELPFRNVEVRTLDDLMMKARKAAGMSERDEFDKYPRDELARRALAALDRRPDAVPYFHHVLIDEAQDFPTEALQFAVRLLIDGHDSLLAVADPVQNIFGTTFTWKAAGINAVGRTKWLDVSYRNTREILEYAHNFVTAGGDFEVSGDPDPEDARATVLPTFSPRSGPLPLLLSSGSPQEEVLAIARHCQALIGDGVVAGDIAVLYGATRIGQFDWPDAIRSVFSELAIPWFWATDPFRSEHRDQIGKDRSKVVLCTIQSAKGLEFRHVILCGYLDDKPPEDSRVTRSLIYVGMTRATHELVLSASGKHPYLADLERV
jgi:hypothetical protein